MLMPPLTSQWVFSFLKYVKMISLYLKNIWMKKILLWLPVNNFTLLMFRMIDAEKTNPNNINP